MTTATATASMRRNQNFTKNRLQFRTGPISAGIMLLALVILLALLYLNQITKTSVYNYKISNLQSKQTELESQKQKLQIEAARLQSVADAKNRVSSAGYTKTDTVTYAQAR